MGAFSVTVANAVLGWLVGQANPTPTAGTRYIALYNGDPKGTGSQVHSRVELTSAMGSASSGQITNTSDITWPRTTSSLGTVTHVAVFDASTGGLLLASGQLTQPVTIPNNVTPVIPAGQLVISMP